MDYNLSCSPNVNNGQLNGVPSNDLLPSCIADFPEAVEWSYSMRREMQEIVKGLFLGPYSVAVRSKVCQLLSQYRFYIQPNDFILFQCNYLEEHGVTHIVCIRQSLEAHIIKTHFTNKFQ